MECEATAGKDKPPSTGEVQVQVQFLKLYSLMLQALAGAAARIAKLEAQVKKLDEKVNGTEQEQRDS